MYIYIIGLTIIFLLHFILAIKCCVTSVKDLILNETLFLKKKFFLIETQQTWSSLIFIVQLVNCVYTYVITLIWLHFIPGKINIFIIYWINTYKPQLAHRISVCKAHKKVSLQIILRILNYKEKQIFRY